MSLRSSADIPVLVVSDNSSSERRVSPSWSLTQLKSKLEPITGVPPGAQELTLRLPHAPQPVPVASHDEDSTLVANFPFQQYAELHVTDTRPPAMRLNLDDSTVEKFVMPEEEYAKRNDSVLAWKKRQNLGRFNPEKEKKEAVELERSWADVEARRIVVGTRCRVGGADLDKRGTVRFVGEVKEIPNKGLWVGFEADEPTGKNNGSIEGERYFTCKPKYGLFVRPDRVEVGDFPVVDEFAGEMEEI